MEIEFDTKELEFSILKFKHLKITRIVREIDTIFFEFCEHFDKAPKQKVNENEREWLKRIPTKYSVRYAKYLYNQAKSLYLEVKTREVMYDYKKLDKKIPASPGDFRSARV